MFKMKKLNKLIAGLTLAATIVAGASQLGQAPNKEVATLDQPVQTYSITSDPGGGVGH
jgi:hypothetical protein